MKNKQFNKTLTGKTGKDLLSLMGEKGMPAQIQDLSAPSGAIELTLVKCWKNLLGHDHFGIKDDFFQAGGNSLKAIQLVSAISKEWLVDIQLTDIFLHSTIEQLAAIIRTLQKGQTLHPAIEPHDRPATIPLSFSQERLWFIHRLEGSIPYHIPAVLRLKGDVNPEALQYALQQVVNRHEILRTVFAENEGRAYQCITPQNDWHLPITDGSKYKGDPVALQTLVQQMIRAPFDLSADPMLRVNLISLEAQDFMLVVTLHHIASDAWSLSILIKEVMELYNAYQQGHPAKLPSLPIQFADYTLWQKQPLQEEAQYKKLQYWKQKLQSLAPQQLPADFAIPVIRNTDGASTEFFISNTLYGQLQELSKAQGCTLFMVLLAGFKVLLHRYSGQQDICVGTSIANRSRPETEGMIGFFVNTLALRTEVDSESSFTSLLQNVKSTTLEAYDNQDAPFEKVVEEVVNERAGGRGVLFRTMLVMPNTPDVQQLHLGDISVTAEAFSHNTSKFDISFFIAETANGLQATVEYSTGLFKAATIHRMMAHFETLLASVVKDPLQKIGLLPMLNEAEEKQLLFTFNDSEVAYPADKSITALFEEQALKTPDNEAVVFEDTQLTYRQLNEHSNQLAHYLKSQGVKPGSLVPLYVERSAEMLVGILGIMKAGAAYVPIDTDLPAERVSYLLEDTQSTIIVSSVECRVKLSPSLNINMVIIDGEELNHQPVTNPEIKLAASQLAYVIYTSGTTGKPKGVMIEHRNLVDYYYGLKKHSPIDQCSSFALVSSIATDLGNTVIYASLLSGGALHIFSKESVSNIEWLHDYFHEHTIDCVKIVPSHWKALCAGESLLLPRKLLVFGGEALQSGMAESIRLSGSACQVVNHYGPTETTIGKLLHVVDPERKYNATIPVGRPFSNTRVYVLSKEWQLCPVGIPGQLYIAGDGLARGYFNNPGLTNEKFITNPFYKEGESKRSPSKSDSYRMSNQQVAGEDTGHGSASAGVLTDRKMYGTGDLVKWLEDGNIEFIGRADDQVKIRGYRVELGEIESVLKQHEAVNQAVVLAKEDKQGNKKLIAYIVPGVAFDKETIIAYLKQKLPDYMIPASVIELEILPLTANGKIDRKALPDPDSIALPGDGYAAPLTEFEKVLSAIWQELLDVEQVGIHDNFFELGGDSIITIQLVSRARRAGYELQVGDVFTYQTIASLVAAVERRMDTAANVAGEQSELSGPAGLLPIQQWFFEKRHTHISHFNQSVLLALDKKVDPVVLGQALDRLMVQHDALRFKYYQKDGQWQQVYEAGTEGIIQQDLRTVSPAQLASVISEHAALQQKGLDIEKGEMIKVVWMQTPDSESQNRLLIVVHHLAIDGVSWRILLGHLELLINGLKTGGKTDLGYKSSSYRQWHTALEQYGRTRRLQSQLTHWQQLVKNYEPLPADKDYTGPLKIQDRAQHLVQLAITETRQLTHEISRAYHTDINDILLSALALTICKWSGRNKITIGLEGHGREAIAEATDASDTVGWFTTHYPVLLQMDADAKAADCIKSVKEQLRQVPDKGIGYGVLKYINKEATLRDQQCWDTRFNYLGQLDNIVSESKWFTLAGESAGAEISDDFMLDEKLLINGFVRDGALVLNWSYSTKHYEEKTITNLAAEYISNLQWLIAHCMEQQKSGVVKTPSDYGLGDAISYQELDHFLAQRVNDKSRKEEIESIAPLSGLQQGMLFHGLYEGGAGIYIRQLDADLVGVNPDIFSRSWAHLLKHHSILRSGFYHDAFSIPVQCVYRDIQLPLEMLDFSAMDEEEQPAAILKYEKDSREKGFDFTTPPLMRVALIRLKGHRFRMVWTWHHILFDGWSMSVLMEAFLKNYELLSSGGQLVLEEEDRFEDYIRYIERSDKDLAQAYWRNYLEGIEHSTQLPFISTTAERNKGLGAYRSLNLLVEKFVSAKILGFVQAHHLTVNSLMQGIWAFLLHRYTGNSRLSFGVIVSGRPDDIPAVERRVGMYINTLPLHSQMQEGKAMITWLQDLQKEQVNSRQFQYMPLHEIQGFTDIKGDLFDTILVFENYPVSNLISSGKFNLKVENVTVHEHNNYPLTITISSGEQIHISFSYNSGLLEEGYVKKMAAHFEQVLLQVINNAEAALTDIRLLGPEEEEQLLVEFNNTSTSYPANKSIVHLFEEQVANTPAAIALVFDRDQVSYSELNERSNQLAHYLTARGVKANDLVPLCIERSVEMMVGILGILKAGAAYVPIDPEYPGERIQYMLEDIGFTVVVTSTVYQELFINKISKTQLVCLDKLEDLLSTCSDENLTGSILPDNLAYVMYTSGSTGKPKGVMVSHGNVVSLVKGVDYVNFTNNDILLSTGSPSFDATTFEYWGMLLNGGRLVLCEENRLLDSGLLKEEIRNRQVSMMWFTAGWFNQLVDTDITVFSGLKTILVGGEKLSEQHIEKIRNAHPSIDILNGYGPTENTTFSLTYKFTGSRIKTPIPIGRPLNNRTVFVLDEQLRLVPVGVAGEIFVGGAGLSKGYLNRSELTEEKFIAHPFNKNSGEKIYRTGDQGRWLPDGNIEYLGRIDQQVKIRGFRIELGEIETVLLQHELVSQAVVLAREDKEGHKRLTGYLVMDGYFDKDEMIAYLKDRLPGYMVPAVWVEMETLPLTRNGKVDKDALPDPDISGLSARLYAPPRNETEETLAIIWQDLLGLERVGIEDNFFELGGDSIITIQLVSRVKHAGYQLQVADVFTCQTIAGLSAVIAQRMGSSVAATGDQTQLKGPCGLLPIQQWFFEKGPRAISHFNQTVLLSIEKEVGLQVLQETVTRLMEHHDALRFKYHREDESWVQKYGTFTGNVVTEDLRSIAPASIARSITELADKHQRGLDIYKGELLRVVWMQTPGSEKDNRLLIVIHHLAVDGVSWRILLEDIEHLISGLIAAESTSLDTKTSSYRQWYHALENYGNSASLSSQLPYWQQSHKKYISLPVDTIYTGQVRVKDRKRLTVKLDGIQTRRLLQEVPKIYHTDINDILLAALAHTLSGWSGNPSIMIGLEGHGREDINGSTDTSRTVGWFTSLYPVLLELEDGIGEAGLIKSVKEQLRLVPGKGLGYGILKYIHKEPSLQGPAPWDIVFNYLGQLDNILPENKWLKQATESAGEAVDEEGVVAEKLSVNGFVQAGELEINWSYSNLHYADETITKLAAEYIANLAKIIDHCSQQESLETSHFTPSDFSLAAEINYKELDQFLEARLNDHSPGGQLPERMYRLSGLQEGMLFHGLYGDAPGAYIVQFGCDLIDADLEIFTKSWDYVMQKHSILRSAFYHAELSIPVQCVYTIVELPVAILDYRGFDKNEQAIKLKEYQEADRLKGFDFTTAPLMRIGLMRLTDNRYRMLWTSHHILFDGWSLPILMEEFLTCYESLAGGGQLAIGQADRFEDYIRYLEHRNKEQEKLYWQQYLAGVETGSLLPFIATSADRNKGAGNYQSLSSQLDPVATAKVNLFAQASHITVNTIVQGVWAFLLHGYTGSDDIVYGVTVSGRPDDLPGVEQRVGMFINTVPLHSVMKEGQAIATWLQGVQEEQVSSRKFQHTPLQDIRSWTGIQGDIFDSIVVFENYPVSKVIAAKHWNLQVENVQTTEQTNYPLSIIVQSAEEINIRFSYNSRLLSDADVELIRGHFEHVLLQVAGQVVTNTDNISLLTAAEENQLLLGFNNTKEAYPTDKNTLDLLEEQAAATPDNIALVFEAERISYQTLNERSNQLAHYLKSIGVQEETLIPICVERSPGMIIAILGILKSGAAYVPIDPAYPAERISYMLEDTAAAIVISSKASRKNIETPGIRIIEIDGDWNTIGQQPVKNLSLRIKYNQLAYVIYTSGSTGKPKGVMLEHGNLYSFICWCREEFSASRFDIVYATTSVCFDLSVFEIFYPLTIGRPVRIIENGLYIGKYLPQDEYVLTNTVPVVIQHLLQEGTSLQNISVMNMAGEPIPSYVQDRLDTENTEVRNLYGPTEDTTYSTSFRLIKNKPVLIGKPIGNTQLQIVNNKGRLVPVGVPGEIYLGGAGLARGYLNRAALTSEKFIQVNFTATTRSRMYRTGDIGRRLPDGNVAYLGRIDDQVKIRGFRVEPGEIETVLLQSGMVSKAAVLVKTDEQGNKKLVGYVVPEGAFNKEAIGAWLHTRLPDYMVPSVWVALESLPLTPNGKIDRKALPDPDSSVLTAEKYIAPRNEMETALAGIWEKILGKEKIGMEDNFFDLGGDSILTIQVVSRARRMGYELQPKDIFIHQTIGRLSAAVKDRALSIISGEQGILTGLSGLLPIQQWWLGNEQPDRSHFNQAIILNVSKMISASELGHVFGLLMEQHDALRFRYEQQQNGQWRQQYGSCEADLLTEDLRSISKELLSPAITEIASTHQRSLDITKGEIIQMVLIQTPAAELNNRLLIVIHHLATDGVSWRILLEDMELFLSAIKEDRKPAPGPKSSSYRQWFHALENYGRSKALLSQLAYWQQAVNSYQPLPVDKEYAGLVSIQEMAAQVVELDAGQTNLLLQEVPRAYHTEINDILLAALALAIARWGGKDQVTIGLESHGREELEAGTDTSRTVGWFTSLYPLSLAVQKNRGEDELIKSVKEQLRMVPDKGLGYGVLKYINKETSLQGNDPWDIVFNYLGQLDNVVGESKWFSRAGESTGVGRSKRQSISEKLSVNALVEGGKLLVNWSYSTRHYNAATVAALANSYLEILAQLIAHCLVQQKSGLVFTPSDYGLGSDISYQELDKFLEAEDDDNSISF